MLNRSIDQLDIRTASAPRAFSLQLVGCMALALLPMLLGCGEEREPLSSDMRMLVDSAYHAALADSARLAASRFTAATSLTMRMEQGDRWVRVRDSFVIRKDSSADFLTEPVSDVIEGDSTMLEDMYSFQDARGRPRGPAHSRLSGLDFGPGFVHILRAIRAGHGSCRRVDVSPAREGTRTFEFETEAADGRFTLRSDVPELVELERVQESDYLIGSYGYRLKTSYARRGGVLLPVATRATFDYRRLFTTGSGSMDVRLEAE